MNKFLLIVILVLSTATSSLVAASDEAPSANRNLRASNPTTLCIYSKLAEGDNCSWSMKKEVGVGHAALSVTRRGETTTYGLWPDWNGDILDHNEQSWYVNIYESDVRKNFPEDKWSRSTYPYKYCETITDTEYNKLLREVNKRGWIWSIWTNCSSFASQVFYKTTGTDVDADDWFLGMETPCELGKNINKLNGD